MARTLATWQFVSLILTAAVFIDINGQCEISNVRYNQVVSFLSSRWECSGPNSEFQVIYQLIRACEHDADNLEGRMPPFGETSWTSNKHFFLYKIPYNIHANSTYFISVHARVWQGDRFIYGSNHEGINITTSEDLYVTRTGSYTSDTMSISWNPYPNQCISNSNITEYEYQLFRSSDEHVAKSNVTTKTAVTLYGLECDTEYRFRVTYRRETGTGPESFITTRTPSETPPTPIVRLNSSSETSLSFLWDEYISQCNPRDDVQVSYDFELRRASPSEILQSGSGENPWISFNNLDEDTDYRFRVRVSTVFTAGSRRSGWSSFASGSSAFSTTPVKQPLHTSTISPGNKENGSEGNGDTDIGLVVAGIALGGFLLSIIVFIALAMYIHDIRSRLRKLKQRFADTNRPNMAAAASHAVPLVGIDNPALNRTETVPQLRVEETDYAYASVGGPDIADQSGYEGINLAEVEREHGYQGLGANP